MRIIHNILYFLVGLLVLVWPMPHIIAVRNIDIGLILILSGFLFFKENQNYFKIDKIEKRLFISIFLFLGWAFFISYISNWREYSFSELKQLSWIVLLGVSSFFIVNSKIEYKKIWIIIFVVFMIFPIYHTLYSFNYYLLHKHLPFRSYGITVKLDELNFLMPYILSFFSVEIILRFLNKKTILKISNALFSLLLFIVIFSLFVQAKRNGIVSIGFMIISVIFFIKLVSHNISKKLILFGVVGVMIASVLVFLNIKEDKRWNKVIQSIDVVFLQNNMDFLNKRVPYGLGESNYDRMIYIREGIKIIKNHPLGNGYGREIFGKVLTDKYKKHLMTHAHSGMIDWGVGLGIPGLLLWSFIVFSLIYIGFNAFMRYESYFGLFVVYLSTSFYFRMFLDSINKDHMFQQFIFLVFLGLFSIYREIHEKNNISSS